MDGKTLVGKILASSDRFAKFANVLHHQRFVLYGTKYKLSEGKTLRASDFVV